MLLNIKYKWTLYGTKLKKKWGHIRKILIPYYIIECY